MQPPGYGGPPGGQGPTPPPGAFPPGAPGAPSQQYAPPHQGAYPGASPGYPAVANPGGYPGAPGQPGAAAPPGAAAYGVPGAAGIPGMQGYPGAQGYPGMQGPAAGYPGAQAYPGAQGHPGAQGYAQGHPGAQAYPGANPAAMMGYGAQPGMAGAMGGAPQNSYGGAQKALSGASTMLKVMRIVFIGIGALCVIGGIVMLVAVDVVAGISTAFTGVVFVAVALLVLPKFFGMMGQATAMVDGLAAKERLAQTGIPASGRLLQVQQTGRLVNYNPEIQALVEVQHPQFGTYQTQTTAVIPQIAIPRAQPGAPVQVRIDPTNRNEIALVF